MARATAAGRGRNPASAAEGIIPGIRARNCITSTISYLHRQRTVPGRPRAEQLPGPPAAGAENRDEPWRPLGAPKLISKPGTAFVRPFGVDPSVTVYPPPYFSRISRGNNY